MQDALVFLVDTFFSLLFFVLRLHPNPTRPL